MYAQGDRTDYIAITSRTCEGVGHFQSNSVADCSWQRYVLTAHKTSFAGGGKTFTIIKLLDRQHITSTQLNGVSNIKM